MSKKGHRPIRLCVACRKKSFKSELIRIVKNKDGLVFLDGSKKAEGRGGYLCRSLKCFDILKRKKALNRSFKMNLQEKLYLDIEKEIERV